MESEIDPQYCKMVLLKTYCVTGLMKRKGNTIEVSIDNGRTWATFGDDMLVSAIPLDDKGREKI